MRAMIAEAKQTVQDLAAEADKLENKHLHDILRDAAGRLHDAENHPDANPQPAGAQTGEANPMDQGVTANVDRGGQHGGSHINTSPFPPAMTGEPNPMAQ